MKHEKEFEMNLKCKVMTNDSEMSKEDFDKKVIYSMPKLLLEIEQNLNKGELRWHINLK